MSKLESNILRG